MSGYQLFKVLGGASNSGPDPEKDREPYQAGRAMTILRELALSANQLRLELSRIHGSTTQVSR